MNAPRIVLIDDNHSWLEALSEFLRAKGLSPTTADDALHGLALLEAGEAPLAIIDLHMPGLDGIELLRRLHRKDIAVLMVSSDDAPATVQRARAAGARGFLAKSAPPVALLRAVFDLLGTLDPPVPIWQRLLPAPRSQPLIPYRR